MKKYLKKIWVQNPENARLYELRGLSAQSIIDTSMQEDHN